LFEFLFITSTQQASRHPDTPRDGNSSTRNDNAFYNFPAFPKSTHGNLPQDLARDFPTVKGPQGQRVIDLLLHSFGPFDSSSIKFPEAIRPVTLLVNNESRKETLRHYKLLFKILPGKSIRREIKPTYYNPELDIVHIVESRI
jgi:hypothetical protein